MANALTFANQTITDANIFGGISYSVDLNAGEEFSIGNTAAASVSFNTDIQLPLYSKDSANGTFTWDKDGVSRGRFYITEVTKEVNMYSVTAYDAMILLENAAISALNISYPVTASALAAAIAAHIGCTISGTVNNGSLSVEEFDEFLPIRSALGYVAEASGCSVKIDGSDHLCFMYYADSGITITASEYISINVADYTCAAIDNVTIFNSEGEIQASAGSGANSLYIGQNPFLEDATNAVAQTILSKVSGFVYAPLTCELFNDDDIEVGTIVTFGTTPTLVMSVSSGEEGATASSVGSDVRAAYNKSAIELVGEARAIAVDAQAAAYDAVTDAAAAKVAAQAAEASASAASVSASNAATSASNAESSASQASASASSASASASSAGQSASNAQAAAEAAQLAALSTITTDTLHYLATSASSGVTRETEGWTTTVQAMTSTNKYLWTYHTYTSANGSTTDSDPVITGVYGEDGEAGEDGATIWTTTVAPVTPNYTFTISNLAGVTGLTPKIGDVIIYSYYRYQITSMTDTTARSTTRVSIRGATGAASKWYTGTGITGTSTTATIFSGSGVSSAVVGDMYLNTNTNNTYRCTTAGAPTVAKWVYVDNIKGDRGIQGETGDDGNGIASIVKTSSSGLVDTYTITYTDGTTATFNLTNGEEGQQGEQGVSVTAVQPQYYLSTSASSATGGSWSNSLSYVTGKYIWTRDMITYSSGTSAPSTAIYNEALTQSCKDAAEALGLIESHQEWFWHDTAGAHVLGETSGYRNDIVSTGMKIMDISGATEVSVAEFGADGAQIGQSTKAHTVISEDGMHIYSVDSNDNLVELANIGYGEGNAQSGTAVAPYYTLGVRESGSTVGNYSTAEGNNTTSSGYASHAEGDGTLASGVRSHAEGVESVASGGNSHAEGQRGARRDGAPLVAYSVTASGTASHAEGSGTLASNDFSHAEGDGTIASGRGSHAEGFQTKASGTNSHAEGFQTTASGYNSHAQNGYTIASSYAQTALGKYNVEDNADTYAVIVGNGTSDTARSNALTVDWQGRVECGDYSGTLKSIFDIFYPVGSYYETSDTTFNPNVSWGGTWHLEVGGQVHVSSGTNYAVDATKTDVVNTDGTVGANQGGSKDAIVPYHNHGTTITQPAFTLPNHTHPFANDRICPGRASTGWASAKVTAGSTTSNKYINIGDATSTVYQVSGTGNPNSLPSCTRSTNVAVTVGYAGSSGNATNANMQPYIVVNRWHRTA